MARLLRIVSAAALLVASSTALADVVTYSSDGDFVATGFIKAFGAQSRWGNNGATGGDWELGIVDTKSTPIAPAQAQFQWSSLPGYSSSTPNHSYSFGYDAATNSATYQILDGPSVRESLTATVPATAGSPAAPINTLALRAALPNPAEAGDVASFEAVRLFFTVGGFVDLGPVVGDANAEYVVLIDNRLAGGFSLSDGATLKDGKGSRPMYEIKVGVTPVPLPAAAWLLLSGIAGLGALSGRRRAALPQA